MSLTLPGDRLGNAMEYMPGPGVYERDGELFAALTGELVRDEQNTELRVKPVVSVPLEISAGERVLGRVHSVRESMATIEVVRVKGKARQVGTWVMGTLHIARMSEDYVSDINEVYRVNDLVQAKVDETKPALKLNTKAGRDGVVGARCSSCRDRLTMVDGELFCTECRQREARKISSEYGQVQL